MRFQQSRISFWRHGSACILRAQLRNRRPLNVGSFTGFQRSQSFLGFLLCQFGSFRAQICCTDSVFDFCKWCNFLFAHFFRTNNPNGFVVDSNDFRIVFFLQHIVAKRSINQRFRQTGFFGARFGHPLIQVFHFQT